MKVKLLTLIVLFAIFATGCNAPDNSSQLIQKYDAISKIMVRNALTNRTGYKWLKDFLKIGPRLSGSPGNFKAIEWIKNKMKEIGLDSVWLQECKVPHWVRGNVEKAWLLNNKGEKIKALHIADLGGSIGTPPKGLTGNVVEVSSFEELKMLGPKAKNKIIFFNEKFDYGEVNTFIAYSKAVKKRVYGAIEAAKVGAKALLIRTVGSSYDNKPHTGNMHYAENVKKIPAAALGAIDSDYLSSVLRHHPDYKIKLKMNCKNLPDTISYNVIGELRGSKFPNEVIVIGGHLDCWDKGVGAHDDGAPALQTLETLDLIKRLNLKPDRTIRCVLFANEENGLNGGKTFGKYAANDKNEKYIAAIESDRGAFTPRGFSVKANKNVLKKIQSWLPVLNNALIDWIKKGGSGADVGQIKNVIASIGYVPDTQRYMDLHHSANDTFDKVHPREMELGTAAIATLVYLISQEGL